MAPAAVSRAARRAASWFLALALAGGAAPAQTAPLASTPLRAVDARSAALLMSGQQGGDLDVRLRAVGVAAAGEGEAGRIEIALDVADDGLAPAGEQESVPLAVHAYALDAAGRLSGWLRQGVRLDPLALATPWRAGVKFLGHLAAPPGDYTLRVLAVRPDTGAFGLVFGPATVPAPGAAAPAAVALEPAQRWLVVRQPRPAGDSRWPPDAAGEELVPATEPVVGRASDAGLTLVLRDADPGAGWLSRLGGAAEREIELDPEGPAAAGWRRWRARFDGRGLPAGDHRLELLAPEAEAPAASLPVAVADPAAIARAEGGALWTDLSGAVAAAAAPMLPAVVPGRELKGDDVELGYLEVLETLAAGDENGAVERLLAYEPAAVAGGKSSDRFARLLEVELQVAADLAQIEIESLLPLVRLHAVAYDAYLDRRSSPMALRSRQLAERLARAYAERRDTPEARQAAARVLESLAGRLLGGGNRFEAARLFAGAVELDPEATVALRGLALLLERNGQYAEALDFYGRAAALAAGDPELELRQALQRLRTGDVAGGERALRELDRDGMPEWIRTVAVEERVRSLAARGAGDEARATLESAIARRPEAGLLLQQAVLLDAAGRRQDAADVLARLEAGGFPDTDSPRLRYDRRQPVTLAASTDAVAAAARRRLPQLAAAREELAGKLGTR